MPLPLAGTARQIGASSIESNFLTGMKPIWLKYQYGGAKMAKTNIAKTNTKETNRAEINRTETKSAKAIGLTSIDLQKGCK